MGIKVYQVVVSNEAHVRVFSLVLRYTVRRACRGIPFLVGGLKCVLPTGLTQLRPSPSERGRDPCTQHLAFGLDVSGCPSL